MFLYLPIWADTTIFDVDYESLHAHIRMTGLYSTANMVFALAGPIMVRKGS
jgi:hypothetical protein